MLTINMFSGADKVKGQGVGSVYDDLLKLLNNRASDIFNITVNRYSKADVSHYHTINFSFFLSTFMMNRGSKVGYVHFLPDTLEDSLKLPKLIKSVLLWYIIIFYKRMDHLVVVNPSFISKLETYGISKDKITYIPNYVSTDVFYPVSAKTKLDLREQHKFKNKFTVLGSGQLQNRKGVPDFIELARRHPEMQFVWTGGFSFGRITDGYEEIKKVVENPPDNLIFTGIVDRNILVQYYNMADIFLLPSYNELFPMSVLESFNTHTPVMLRDLSMYQTILRNDYLAAKDVNEMDQHLIRLSQDSAAIDILERKAKDAADYYSEDRLIEIWKNFYVKRARED